MKRSRSLVWSVTCSVAAALGLAAVPSRPAPPPAPALAPKVVRAAEPTASGEADAPRADLHVLADALAWGSDPFAALPQERPTEPDLQPSPEPEPEPEVDRAPQLRLELTGVSLHRGRYLAIVDRELVSVGSELPSGHLVTEIGPSSITVRLDDQELTFTLADTSEDQR